MKLSIKISIVIGIISIVVSSFVAGLSYFIQLEQVTARNQVLVTQMANSAAKPSAIAAYLNDTELANEIVAGLAANDLIASASITVSNTSEIIAQGQASSTARNIRIDLVNPFIADDVIGYIDVYADLTFIRELASDSSLQNAMFMLGLSIFIALLVGFYIRFKLTSPIKKLSNEVSAIDTQSPDEMQVIELNYKHSDEIGILTEKTNSLISALKKRFLSERDLLNSTQELQKRFRLLFEQATAGIGLLNQESKVTIANPACQDLFGAKIKGKSLADFFESPQELSAQLSVLRQQKEVSQVDIDLSLVVNGEVRYLHCLFSSIADSRLNARDSAGGIAISGDEDDLSQFVEFIVYDVTERRRQEIKTRYEADHDALTGLLNRRAGQNELQNMLAGLTHKEQFFAIMMIDLNKFKPINDTHGHEAGDAVLVEVAKQLSEQSPDSQLIVIRWGGDEFLLGMYVQNQQQLEEITCDLLRKIRSEVVFNDIKLRVGASIGIMLLNHDKKDSWTVEDIIKESDELMYEAKLDKSVDYTIKRIGEDAEA
jgi:diguanylate cyclase (GGDEF)-like protein/PAS domain S-box-containing protein